MIDVTAAMLGLTIRPLGRTDAGWVAEGVRRLSRRSLLARFGTLRAGGPDLGWLWELDGIARVAYGAAEAATGEPVGVGRYVELPDDPGHVEIAVTIVDAWQARGVGTLLARELRTHARRARMQELFAVITDGNRPAARIMAGLGASRASDPGGHLLEFRAPVA